MTDERRGSINGPLGDHPQTLVEFLTPRLDEDGQTARIAAEGKPGHWRVPPDHPHLVEEYPNPCEHGHDHCHVDSCVVYQEDAPALPHIARWDPARVLAEVEAKRQIIKHETSGRVVDQGAPEHTFTKSPTQDDEAWMERWTQPIVDTPVLRMLALPYADHSDYRPEWRI